jgi:hypothetical protein
MPDLLNKNLTIQSFPSAGVVPLFSGERIAVLVNLSITDRQARRLRLTFVDHPRRVLGEVSEQMSSAILQTIRQAEEIAARKASKEAQLESLVQDPDCADWVLRWVEDIRKGLSEASSNGNSHESIFDPVEQQGEPFIIRMRPQGGKNGNGIRNAIRALDDLPTRFTASDVLQRLNARNFPFVAEPNSAIKDALYALKRRHELRVSFQGSGGKPSKYEWTHRKGSNENGLLI